SRGGGALLAENPTGLSRITYLLDDEGQMLRRSRPIFQGEQMSEEAQQQILLRGVAQLIFEQLNAQYDYVPVWPPLNEEHELNSLPLMIRVTIEMEDGSSTTRTFA